MVGYILIVAVIVLALIWIIYDKGRTSMCKTNACSQCGLIDDSVTDIKTTDTCETIPSNEGAMNMDDSFSQNEIVDGYEKMSTIEKKITFLHEKIIQLNQISKELENAFPDKSFKLDGIIVGNIVEILAAFTYGMSLYRQSEKTHDGEINGIRVQIKGTQSNKRILIGEKPEHLLVEYLNTETGEIEEIYNGPGELIWKYVTPISPTQNSITVAQLLNLDRQVDDKFRLQAILPIKKYQSAMMNSNILCSQPIESHAGKTTTIGYTNRNNQTNKGCLNKPGTHSNQMAYLLHCNNCGYEYEANGCDIAIRKCPICQ